LWKEPGLSSVQFFAAVEIEELQKQKDEIRPLPPGHGYLIFGAARYADAGANAWWQ
jgi:hypothetical protein